MDILEPSLLNAGFCHCPGCTKYSPAGKTLSIDNEYLRGIYWYYETDSFIIDIHDFFIKKEMVEDSLNSYPCLSFISTYIISANGEWFNPYQILTSNTMLIMNMAGAHIRFLLHANYPFFSVAINFKNKMIDECIVENLKIEREKVSNLFLETRELVTKPMGELSAAIINCSMVSPGAELFFEAKAKEWLGRTLDAYSKLNSIKPLSGPDKASIENVADYINDHYAMDISQELLERIAMMSGTKLKSCFRQKYQMSITEYTQRKRMNMAENLLLTTGIEIGDVAKSVGYSSHSRFTTLFKKYKGIYPHEVKKLQVPNGGSPICTCK